MKLLKVLGICGSLRRQSTNMTLLRYAQANAPAGMGISVADITAVPLYNQDVVEKPAAVKTLLDQIEQADALLFACPEYNYSIAPALKNALDWASREPDNRLLAGPVAMMENVSKTVQKICQQKGVCEPKVIVSLNPIMMDGTGMCGGCRVLVQGSF
jgi:NAD(P)H-dependent FMN reductase